MPVNIPPIADLLPVPGVLLGTAAANVKTSLAPETPANAATTDSTSSETERDDIAVIVLAEGASVAGVFTQSSFRAPPVTLCIEHLDNEAKPRLLVINSGNANAATGALGRADALDCARALADEAGLSVADVLPFSTGVIGERLPVARMVPAIQAAWRGRSEHAWLDAARAIMTTDTVPKVASVRGTVAGVELVATGMSKGSGMVRPDMATVLGYLATDASVATPVLQTLTRELADQSFNRITVDGDTSTNDSFVVIASGQAQMAQITDVADPTYAELKALLLPLTQDIAQRVVRDGEGATKFVTITVEGGRDTAECREVAYTIAHSPLVKTAMFAGDANWGRFCMAIGRAQVERLDPSLVSLYLNDVCVAKNGMMDGAYEEAAGAAVMACEEFEVRVELGRGSASDTVWTSDFSYDYVRINAEYRT